MTNPTPEIPETLPDPLAEVRRLWEGYTEDLLVQVVRSYAAGILSGAQYSLVAALLNAAPYFLARDVRCEKLENLARRLKRDSEAIHEVRDGAERWLACVYCAETSATFTDPDDSDMYPLTHAEGCPLRALEGRSYR